MLEHSPHPHHSNPTVRRTRLALALLLVTVAACGDGRNQGPPPPLEPEARARLVERAGAPLFDGLGSFHRAVSTSDEGAQRYFDQGMVITFGFNHAEAARAFRAAQKLDPQCAMCVWGEALALGPNINVTSNGKAIMSDEDRRLAYEVAQRAVALSENAKSATESERALIQALATRYNGDPSTPREPLDLAYADAMRGVAATYPDDDDVQALFAEALMTTMPWDYWLGEAQLDESEPKPGTVEVLTALETVMARSPEHPLALHLYIHAVEASDAPERAEPAADRLAQLVPASGHLVHMPAHIYWRLGRYDDASEANIRAAAVDEQYIAQCNAQGFYPALYYPHNIHFLWSAASMQGRSELALESARKVAANVNLEQIEQFPSVEFFQTIPLLSLVRFSRWDEVLAEPQPPAQLDYSTAIWHYARGVALANRGQIKEANAERSALVPLQDKATISFLDSVDYPASALLAIADELLLGEIALAQKKHDVAIGHFEKAVAGQDALPYTEPPFWYYPTRQSLGGALLIAGNAVAAEEVFRQDLEDYPHNGWSLYGVIESLEAQGKDATELREHFEHAWAKADIQLSTTTHI